MSKFENAEKFVKTLAKRFPKVAKLVRAQEAQNYGSVESLADVASGKRKPEVEKLALYTILTAGGPDMEWSRLGRPLRLVRKRIARGDVLRAYERNKLQAAVEAIGYFGPRSDESRAPADRYW